MTSHDARRCEVDQHGSDLRQYIESNRLRERFAGVLLGGVGPGNQPPLGEYAGVPRSGGVHGDVHGAGGGVDVLPARVLISAPSGKSETLLNDALGAGMVGVERQRSPRPFSVGAGGLGMPERGLNGDGVAKSGKELRGKRVHDVRRIESRKGKRGGARGGNGDVGGEGKDGDEFGRIEVWPGGRERGRSRDGWSDGQREAEVERENDAWDFLVNFIKDSTEGQQQQYHQEQHLKGVYPQRPAITPRGVERGLTPRGVTPRGVTPRRGSLAPQDGEGTRSSVAGVLKLRVYESYERDGGEEGGEVGLSKDIVQGGRGVWVPAGVWERVETSGGESGLKRFATSRPLTRGQWEGKSQTPRGAGGAGFDDVKQLRDVVRPGGGFAGVGHVDVDRVLKKGSIKGGAVLGLGSDGALEKLRVGGGAGMQVRFGRGIDLNPKLSRKVGMALHAPREGGMGKAKGEGGGRRRRSPPTKKVVSTIPVIW